MYFPLTAVKPGGEGGGRVRRLVVKPLKFSPNRPSGTIHFPRYKKSCGSKVLALVFAGDDLISWLTTRCWDPCIASSTPRTWGPGFFNFLEDYNIPYDLYLVGVFCLKVIIFVCVFVCFPPFFTLFLLEKEENF